MSPDELNPYAAPQSDLGPPPGAGAVPGENVWRDGPLLVFRKGARLVDRCVKCNEPGDGRMLRRLLYWHPWWVYLTLLVCTPWLYIIVALIARHTASIDIGLCSRHRARRRLTILTAWSIVIGSIVVVFMTIDSRSRVAPWLSIGAFVALLSAAICGAVASRMIAAKRIDPFFAWVGGVCPEYLDRLPPLHGELTLDTRPPVELHPNQ
jgi:hypothetical protein